MYSQLDENQDLVLGDLPAVLGGEKKITDISLELIKFVMTFMIMPSSYRCPD